jgi:hypothetical protein
MLDAHDLVQRLSAAAVKAIADERQGLTYEPERLRGLVVDLEIGRSGEVIGAVYVERTTRPTRARRV